jgi:hypothetical protein
LAARIEGRRRWLERMRLAKEQGLIEKIPGGRLPGVRGRARSQEPRQAQLEREADRTIEMALKKGLPAPMATAPEDASDAELFADNFRDSLLFNREVLRRPIEWGDIELLKLKKEVSLATQTAAVRIKVAELRPPGDEGVVERLMARVAAIRRGERAIEIEGDVEESDGSR